MRDPEGSVHVTPDGVVRTLNGPLAASHFLHSPAARQLAEQGKLVPFEWQGELALHSPLVDFVSLPSEWSDAQLRAAADLTLDVARQALAGGFELKDASAWNVIFDGSAPLFCDHLSFQPAVTRQWWAFGQFVRHFVFPLGVSQVAGLPAHGVFRLQRDGLAPQQVRKMLGLRRFGTRLWPLLVGAAGGKASGGGAAPAAQPGQPMQASLFALCEWSLGKLGRGARRNRHWHDYTATRTHYTDAASELKYRQVGQWLAALQPQWVIDLGCNTGEFSRMAADGGARVIALDSDHDSIEQLFLQAAGRRDLHPVLANLADLSGGAGWGGSEHPALLQRLHKKADVLLMLALIHHLAVSESIPFERIAELAAGMTRRYLVVEFIGQQDPLLGQLAGQRRRDPAEFALALQQQAFARYFRTVEQVEVSGTARTLALLEVL